MSPQQAYDRHGTLQSIVAQQASTLITPYSRGATNPRRQTTMDTKLCTVEPLLVGRQYAACFIPFFWRLQICGAIKFCEKMYTLAPDYHPRWVLGSFPPTLRIIPISIMTQTQMPFNSSLINHPIIQSYCITSCILTASINNYRTKYHHIVPVA